MITIEHDALHGPLRTVCAAVAKNSTMPVLSNLLMHYDRAAVRLTGSDLETSITAHVHAKSDDEGAITLPAHKLLSIVSTATPGDPITLKLDDGKARIRAGRASWRLSTLPAEDFPDTGDDEPINTIDIESAPCSRVRVSASRGATG